MNVPKAIEILFDLLQTSSRDKSPDSWDALKLGIEALKHFQYQRDNNLFSYVRYLPGETEED